MMLLQKSHTKNHPLTLEWTILFGLFKFLSRLNIFLILVGNRQYLWYPEISRD